MDPSLRSATSATRSAAKGSRDEEETMRILITGAAGFICGHLIPELLTANHEVIGVDDLGRYGAAVHPYDSHPRYRFVHGDVRDTELMRELAMEADQIVATAGLHGQLAHQLGVAHVAVDEPVAGMAVVRVDGGAVASQVIDTDDVVVGIQQLGDQVAADEPRGAGDQDPHGLLLIPRSLRGRTCRRGR